MELSVTTSRQDDVSVVTVAGEVDVYTAAQLRTALDEEIAAGRAWLVVDLDEVSFLDSTGLGVLVGRLKLVRNTPAGCGSSAPTTASCGSSASPGSTRCSASTPPSRTRSPRDPRGGDIRRHLA